MVRNWSDFDPNRFAHMMLREFLEWVGTSYLRGGQTKGVSTDCSGMVIETFKLLGLEITDRTSNSLYNEIFSLTQPLYRGPVVKAIFGYEGGGVAEWNHIGIEVNSRYVIHATDDATWVAQNGGVDGVMLTTMDNYLSRLEAVRDAVMTKYLDFAALISYHNSEAP